jgi:hypothetical protein
MFQVMTRIQADRVSLDRRKPPARLGLPESLDRALGRVRGRGTSEPDP